MFRVESSNGKDIDRVLKSQIPIKTNSISFEVWSWKFNLGIQSLLLTAMEVNHHHKAELTSLTSLRCSESNRQMVKISKEFQKVKFQWKRMQFHLKFGVENLILEFLEAFQLKLMSFSSDHFNSVSRVFQMQVVFFFIFISIFDSFGLHIFLLLLLYLRWSRKKKEKRHHRVYLRCLFHRRCHFRWFDSPPRNVWNVQWPVE